MWVKNIADSPCFSFEVYMINSDTENNVTNIFEGLIVVIELIKLQRLLVLGDDIFTGKFQSFKIVMAEDLFFRLF